MICPSYSIVGWVSDAYSDSCILSMFAGSYVRLNIPLVELPVWSWVKIVWDEARPRIAINEKPICKCMITNEDVAVKWIEMRME